MVSSAPVAHPFDALAAGYDAAFTDRRLGRWLREIVWAHLDDAFAPGDHVLEIGCGTGEDATHLARRGVRVTATDASPEMIRAAEAKTTRDGVASWMTFAVWDAADPAAAPDGPFDGVFSSFGALNCVADRRALAATLARLVRPGGEVVLVLMGPICPWEMVWLALHGHPRAAVRRLRHGRQSIVGGQPLAVWYPSPRTLRADLSPWFAVRDHVGVGLLLPPTELGDLVDRAPRLFAPLAAADRRMQRAFPWRWLNDHYLLRLERVA